MPLRVTVQLLWHWMQQCLTCKGLICNTKPLLWLLWLIFTDSVNHQIYWSLLYKDTRQSSKLVNKKSWLQVALKHCINYSELEHLSLCDIYNVVSWCLILEAVSLQKSIPGYSFPERNFCPLVWSVQQKDLWSGWQIWTFIRFKPISFSAWGLATLYYT